MRSSDLHDVEEALLPQAVLLLEEVVFWVRARDVPTYHLKVRYIT